VRRDLVPEWRHPRPSSLTRGFGARGRAPEMSCVGPKGISVFRMRLAATTTEVLTVIKAKNYGSMIFANDRIRAVE
jgi:hypothetical protein